MTTQNWHDSRIAPPDMPSIERKQLYLPDTNTIYGLLILRFTQAAEAFIASPIPLFAGIVLFALGSGLVEPSLQSRP
jgi:hypothetical protein